MACSEEYNWDELLSTLTELFGHDEIDADQVIKIMSGYKSDPRDWGQYALFDPHRYNLLPVRIINNVREKHNII